MDLPVMFLTSLVVCTMFCLSLVSVVSTDVLNKVHFPYCWFIFGPFPFPNFNLSVTLRFVMAVRHDRLPLVIASACFSLSLLLADSDGSTRWYAKDRCRGRVERGRGSVSVLFDSRIHGVRAVAHTYDRKVIQTASEMRTIYCIWNLIFRRHLSGSACLIDWVWRVFSHTFYTTETLKFDLEEVDVNVVDIRRNHPKIGQNC